MNKLINIETLPPVFEVRKIIGLSGGKITRRALNYSISKLLREKRLIRLRNGIYSKVGDIFYIAYRLYNGYIGFSSALYLYGLKEEIEANVYVCITSSAKPGRIMGRLIVPVNMGINAYGASLMELSGREVLVSTYAKTIFDMLSRPRYANYFDMYRSMKLRPLGHDEWKELLHYAGNSNITDIRRIGYAMEGIAPGWFIKELGLLSKKGYRASFFFRHEAKNYNGKWDIYDSLYIRRWADAV